MTPEPTVIVIEGTQGEQGEKGEQGNLGVALPSGTALFETSLQAPITSTAVTMTVRANSVSGGNTLTGYQCFTIDEGSAQAEFVCGTISGTTVSSMTRGVDPITATSTNSALQFAHRRGANVKITDFPLIQVMRNIINGGESFPNALTFDSKLTYSSAPSFTNALDITTKAYADAIANQGAATSTEAVGGISELATQAEMASSTDFGTDSPHVMQSKYATSTPYGTTASGLYAVVSKINGKIDQLWLDLTEDIDFLGNVTVPADNTAGGFAPIGTLLTYATSTAPTGWLLADGTSYSTTTYSALFAVVGYSYGGSTSTFAVPDFSGRVAVGYGSATTTYDTMGETGGEDKHVLTVAELAAHTHTIAVWDDAGGTPSTFYVDSAGVPSSYKGPAISNSTGGDEAHNNMQPFIVMNYIIKY